MADKGYRSKSFEADLAEADVTFIRPAMHNEEPRPHIDRIRTDRLEPII